MPDPILDGAEQMLGGLRRDRTRRTFVREATAEAEERGVPLETVIQERRAKLTEQEGAEAEAFDRAVPQETQAANLRKPDEGNPQLRELALESRYGAAQQMAADATEGGTLAGAMVGEWARLGAANSKYLINFPGVSAMIDRIGDAVGNPDLRAGMSAAMGGVAEGIEAPQTTPGKILGALPAAAGAMASGAVTLAGTKSPTAAFAASASAMYPYARTMAESEYRQEMLHRNLERAAAGEALESYDADKAAAYARLAGAIEGGIEGVSTVVQARLLAPVAGRVFRAGVKPAARTAIAAHVSQSLALRAAMGGAGFVGAAAVEGAEEVATELAQNVAGRMTGAIPGASSSFEELAEVAVIGFGAGLILSGGAAGVSAGIGKASTDALARETRQRRIALAEVMGQVDTLAKTEERLAQATPDERLELVEQWEAQLEELEAERQAAGGEAIAAASRIPGATDPDAAKREAHAARQAHDAAAIRAQTVRGQLRVAGAVMGEPTSQISTEPIDVGEALELMNARPAGGQRSRRESGVQSKVEKLGYRVVWFDTDAPAGHQPAAYARQTPGVVYLRAGQQATGRTLYAAAVHEIVHDLQWYDPALYAQVREILGDAAVARQAASYALEQGAEYDGATAADMAVIDFLTGPIPEGASADPAEVDRLATGQARTENEGAARAIEAGAESVADPISAAMARVRLAPRDARAAVKVLDMLRRRSIERGGLLRPQDRPMAATSEAVREAGSRDQTAARQSAKLAAETDRLAGQPDASPAKAPSRRRRKKAGQKAARRAGVGSPQFSRVRDRPKVDRRFEPNLRSRLEETISGVMDPKAPPRLSSKDPAPPLIKQPTLPAKGTKAQMLAAMKKAGVKNQEIHWRLGEFLAGYADGDPMTREQIAEAFNRTPIVVSFGIADTNSAERVNLTLNVYAAARWNDRAEPQADVRIEWTQDGEKRSVSLDSAKAINEWFDENEPDPGTTFTVAGDVAYDFDMGDMRVPEDENGYENRGDAVTDYHDRGQVNATFSTRWIVNDDGSVAIDEDADGDAPEIEFSKFEASYGHAPWEYELDSDFGDMLEDLRDGGDFDFGLTVYESEWVDNNHYDEEEGGSGEITTKWATYRNLANRDNSDTQELSVVLEEQPNEAFDYDEPHGIGRNMVAHARVTFIGRGDTLFVDEVQSKLLDAIHKAGKEIADPQLMPPDAPYFKQNPSPEWRAFMRGLDDQIAKLAAPSLEGSVKKARDGRVWRPGDEIILEYGEPSEQTDIQIGRRYTAAVKVTSAVKAIESATDVLGAYVYAEVTIYNPAGQAVFRADAEASGLHKPEGQSVETFLAGGVEGGMNLLGDRIRNSIDVRQSQVGPAFEDNRARKLAAPFVTKPRGEGKLGQDDTWMPLTIKALIEHAIAAEVSQIEFTTPEEVHESNVGMSTKGAEINYGVKGKIAKATAKLLRESGLESANDTNSERVRIRITPELRELVESGAGFVQFSRSRTRANAMRAARKGTYVRGIGYVEPIAPQWARVWSSSGKVRAAHSMHLERVDLALDMGGIPAPSLEVGSIETPVTWSNAGNLTLFLGPDAAERYLPGHTFAADIYSRRHPQLDQKTNAVRRAADVLDDIIKYAEQFRGDRWGSSATRPDVRTEFGTETIRQIRERLDIARLSRVLDTDLDASRPIVKLWLLRRRKGSDPEQLARLERAFASAPTLADRIAAEGEIDNVVPDSEVKALVRRFAGPRRLMAAYRHGLPGVVPYDPARVAREIGGEQSRNRENPGFANFNQILAEIRPALESLDQIRGNARHLAVGNDPTYGEVQEDFDRELLEWSKVMQRSFGIELYDHQLGRAAIDLARENRIEGNIGGLDVANALYRAGLITKDKREEIGLDPLLGPIASGMRAVFESARTRVLPRYLEGKPPAVIPFGEGGFVAARMTMADGDSFDMGRLRRNIKAELEHLGLEVQVTPWSDSSFRSNPVPDSAQFARPRRPRVDPAIRAEYDAAVARVQAERGDDATAFEAMVAELESHAKAREAWAYRQARERFQDTIARLRQQLRVDRDIAEAEKQKWRRKAAALVRILPNKLQGGMASRVADATTPIRVMRLSEVIAARLAMAEYDAAVAELRKVAKRLRKRKMPTETRQQVDAALGRAAAIGYERDPVTGDPSRRKLRKGELEDLLVRAEGIEAAVQEALDAYEQARLDWRNQRDETADRLRLIGLELAKRLLRKPTPRRRPGSSLTPAQARLTDPSVYAAADFDLVARTVDGERNGPLAKLVQAIKDAESQMLLGTRAMMGRLDTLARAAGYADLDALRDAASNRRGAAVSEYQTVELGGKRHRLTVGQIMKLIALDYETRTIVTDSPVTGPEGTIDIKAGVGIKLGDSKDGQVIRGVTMDELEQVAVDNPRLEAFVVLAKAYREQELRPAAFSTFERMKGYSPPMVPGYEPRRRDIGGFALELDSPAGAVSASFAQNAGMTKDRTNNGLPVIVDSFLEDYIQNADSSLRLAHLAEPVRDLWAITMDGEIRERITRSHGARTLEAIRVLVMHGASLTPSYTGGIVSTLSSLRTQAALATNPSTWIKVLGGGVVNLALDMDPRDIAAGGRLLGAFTMEDVESRSGYLWERNAGDATDRRSTVREDHAGGLQMSSGLRQSWRAMQAAARNLALAMHAKQDDVGVARMPAVKDAAMQFAAVFDPQVMSLLDRFVIRVAVAGHLSAVMAEQPSMPRTEQLDLAVARAERTIRRTQNVSSPMDDSRIAAETNVNKQQHTRALMPFASDPLKSAARLAEAVQDGVAKGAGRWAAVGLTNTAIGVVAATAVALIRSALSGDDEEFESLYENARRRRGYDGLAGKAVNELLGRTGFVGFIIGGDAAEAAIRTAQGRTAYSPELGVLAVDAINDVGAQALDLGERLAAGDDIEPKRVWKLLTGIASGTGLPAPVMRLMEPLLPEEPGDALKAGRILRSMGQEPTPAEERTLSRARKASAR